MDQVSKHSIVLARAEGPVEVQLEFYALRADIFLDAFGIQVPAAVRTERGRIDFDLTPAISADQILRRRCPDPTLTAMALFRINNLQKSVQKSARHGEYHTSLKTLCQFRLQPISDPVSEQSIPIPDRRMAFMQLTRVF